MINIIFKVQEEEEKEEDGVDLIIIIVINGAEKVIIINHKKILDVTNHGEIIINSNQMIMLGGEIHPKTMLKKNCNLMIVTLGHNRK